MIGKYYQLSNSTINLTYIVKKIQIKGGFRFSNISFALIRSNLFISLRFKIPSFTYCSICIES